MFLVTGASAGRAVFGNAPSVTYIAVCSVTASTAGAHVLRIGYSSVASFSRLVWVNGVSRVVAFPTTGSGVFRTVDIPVSLNAGTNQIRLDLSYVLFDTVQVLT